MEEKSSIMKQTNNSIVKEIKQSIEKFEESQSSNISKANLYDETCRNFVIEISKTVAQAYENLVEKLRGSPLEKFQNRLSKISYKSTGNLFEYIEALTVKRKQMIEIINAYADALDNSYYMTTICRLTGSFVDLLHNLDAFFEHNLSNFIIEETFGIHPVVGLVSQALCKCVPHFAYLGLVSSFLDVLNSKVIMRNILKIIQEDIKMFENIDKWFQETNESDKELKKLFPFEVDAEIVSDIEQILKDYDSYTKVFATVFFSNIKQNPSLMTDEMFLCKAYLFSRNEIAKEWYDRALKMKHPIEFEAEKLEYRAKLMRLSRSSPDSNATVEIGTHVIKLKNAPHFVQATVNCVSIYFSFQELLIGAQNKNSEILREFSKRAKFCLDELQKTKRQLESK